MGKKESEDNEEGHAGDERRCVKDCSSCEERMRVVVWECGGGRW